MPLRTPSFWYDKTSATARAKATALSSLCALYAIGHMIHQHMHKAQSAGIPVLCVGNIVVGGSGKTPTALAVMELIRAEKLANNPCFLSRGYGGALAGPVQVDSAVHNAAMVGDEPLLLAAAAPTIICANRLKGAQFAKTQGYDFIVMDDGMQNPSLKKDISIVVIDGATGFGNGLLLPAGPLRTPIHSGLDAADAVLLIGDDATGVLDQIPAGKPVLRANLTALPPLSGARNYFAFCGIAHPQKFWTSLEKADVRILGLSSFADHHPYTASDIETLKKQAAEFDARLITTTKDAARIGPDLLSRSEYDTLDITLNFDDTSRDTLMGMIRHAH